MGMNVGAGGDSMSEINVTPFIDVCLVLLIIFMIVTPIVLKGFNVNIPPKASDEEQKQFAQALSQQIILTLTSDGRIKLNQEEVPRQALLSRIVDLFERRGGKRVIFFNAEDDVLYGNAVDAMDVLRQAKAETIGIVIETIKEN